MLSAFVIGALIIAILGPTTKRMLDLGDPPKVAWPLMLFAALIPCAMGWIVLNPPPPVDEADLSMLASEAVLEAPAGHSILVTATLTEDPKGPKAGKSNYALAISGDGWAQKATAEIRRKVEEDEDSIDVNVIEGEQLSESGRRRGGKWGEDLEERFDLQGPGPVKIELTNFDGDAASGVHISVIKSPPSDLILWPLALVLGAIGLAIELKWGPTQLGGDIAFLALYGVFLRDGVTPADSFQKVAFAAFPAAVVGWGIFASAGYLVERSRAKKAKEEERQRKQEEEQALAEANRRRRGR
ncbi:MAG: hypothetical protein H6742_18970 [Alphaproteobacteria bacterium]|nr:hypothetical protein [Alphaproteobacteria bacterium]